MWRAVCACVCVLVGVYCCGDVGTHITVLHLDSGCTLGCNLTLRSSNSRSVRVRVCPNTQVASSFSTCSQVLMCVCMCECAQL